MSDPQPKESLNYLCYATNKRHPIEIHGATSSYDAQQRAANVWRIAAWKVTPVLVEKDGQPVVHRTSDL